MAVILTPMQEVFATGLAAGLSQSEAYRRAYPRSLAWKDESVWQKASTLAADVKVRARVDELMKSAAAANGVTVERIVSELVKVAFGDLRQVMTWGPSGMALRDSEALDEKDAATVAEVSQTVSKDGGSLKVKRHDKVKALELLGRHVGAFETDNRQRNPLGSFDPGRFFSDLFRKPQEP
jgi:phage terminase small subunit